MFLLRRKPHVSCLPGHRCRQASLKYGLSVHIFSLQIWIELLLGVRPWWACWAGCLHSGSTPSTWGSCRGVLFPGSSTFCLFPTQWPPRALRSIHWYLVFRYLVSQVLYLHVIWFIVNSELCPVEAPVFTPEPQIWAHGHSTGTEPGLLPLSVLGRDSSLASYQQQNEFWDWILRMNSENEFSYLLCINKLTGLKQQSFLTHNSMGGRFSWGSTFDRALVLEGLLLGSSGLGRSPSCPSDELHQVDGLLLLTGTSGLVQLSSKSAQVCSHSRVSEWRCASFLQPRLRAGQCHFCHILLVKSRHKLNRRWNKLYLLMGGAAKSQDKNKRSWSFWQTTCHEWFLWIPIWGRGAGNKFSL